MSIPRCQERDTLERAVIIAVQKLYSAKDRTSHPLRSEESRPRRRLRRIGTPTYAATRRARTARLMSLQFGLDRLGHNPNLADRRLKLFRCAGEALGPVAYFVIFMDVDPFGVLR